MIEITLEDTGDIAYADTPEAAIVAARTLRQDYIDNRLGRHTVGLKMTYAFRVDRKIIRRFTTAHVPSQYM